MKRAQIKEIILLFLKTRNMKDTARALGISRWTVSRWVRKGKTFSPHYIKWQGLVRKSTKPHHIHFKLSLAAKADIVNLRTKKHIGAKKLVYRVDSGVSSRTIHRFLKQKGLILKQKQYRRPLFQNGHAMRPSNTKALGYLQMDTKHVTPELSGLEYTVYEFAAIDITSRYKLAVLLPDITDESASLALQYFLKWFPFEIQYVQTDNGLEFQGVFQELCEEKKINHYFIHKNSPNENAVIERSFRTDQDEFYYWLEQQPQHIGELNSWLQEFINQYNTWRPHQSLNYKTPEEVVHMLQMS